MSAPATRTRSAAPSASRTAAAGLQSQIIEQTGCRLQANRQPTSSNPAALLTPSNLCRALGVMPNIVYLAQTRRTEAIDRLGNW